MYCKVVEKVFMILGMEISRSYKIEGDTVSSRTYSLASTVMRRQELSACAIGG